MTTDRVLDFVSCLAGEVSNVANEVAQRWPPLSFPTANQPLGQRNLDVTYITERLLATSKPADAPILTRNDVGRDEHPATKDQTRSSLTTEENMDAGVEGHRQPQHRRTTGVNPGTLSTFLTRRHGTHYLAINLSEEDPDDRTLLLLNRQILSCRWSSPCIHKSETPCLPHILDICYAMHAFLSLHAQNVICVYCANGRTRTAIVIACYLKFSRQSSTSLEGFRLFLSKRCPQLDPNTTLQNIPPSLVKFFRNFDDAVELGAVLNPKPLLLRAIAVQGVPVDDKPCIDIYTQSAQHVYSSHDDETLSQWADEEGFYRVNQVLEGDFVLLCRFGGPYRDEADDPSKVLFRYANTTGFLASGPYELPKSKVDMMRRYVQSFDDEDFSLTLLMESYWNCTDEDNKQRLEQDCDDKVMPPILEGRDAMERGWHLITERHAAHPESQDVQVLIRSFPELQECPSHLCTLALQLTNFDFETARSMLFVGKMKSWWRKEADSDLLTEPMEEDKLSKDDDCGRKRVTPSPDQGCLDILRILDEVDGESASSALYDDARDGDVTMSLTHAQQEQEVPQLLYEPILFPNRGDIVDSFGDYYKQMNARNGRQRSERPRRPITLGSKPRMPLVPLKKRVRAEGTADPQKRSHVDPFSQIGAVPNPPGANGDFVYDEDFTAAMEIFMQIRHTGVTLEDLQRLQASSREWNASQLLTLQQPLSDENGQSALQTGETVAISTMYAVSAASEERDVVTVPPVNEERHAIAVAPSKERATGAGWLISGVAEEKAISPHSVASVSDKDKDSGANESNGGVDEMHGNVMGERIDSPLKADEEVPLEDDPEYKKYFQMLKMRLPIEAVTHAMKRDGKDPTIIDLHPKKSLKSQQQEQRRSESSSSDEPALKEDPEYQKYYRMRAMGLPLDAVKHAMKRDGKDPTIMDLDPKKSLKSQQGRGQSLSDDGPPLRDDPEYNKYWKMLKMGLPAGAVKNALARDGKDPSIIDLDPEKSLKSQTNGLIEDKDDGPPLCEDPEYSKYFRMMKLGLPVGAARNAMQRDGKDPSIMDLDPNKSLKSQTKNEVIDTGVAMKDDPEYTKYFKMLTMGLPMGAVKNALQRDGKDPSIMDLDPDKSVAFQLRQKSGRGVHRKKEKKRVRRKKIYWTPIDPGKVNEESIWSMVRGSVVMDKLKYDPKEFENLFTESTNPADKKKAAASNGDKSKQAKKSVQVIEGKRSMNGGIILARLKMEYAQIAEMVDAMDSGMFDSTQLSALKEFLPTDDEHKALQDYLKDREHDMNAAMADLSECEKYMAAMMKVDNAASKFDCMIFMVQFNGRIDELVDGITIITKACDEVRSSERLRKMMAMILTLVNEINTGGDGNVAVGFSLDALLKLHEAKAFDKKTSVLQYLVKLVKQNDDSLLDFKHDIESVAAAEGVILDGLQGDAKDLLSEVTQVRETAKNEADRLEKEGKITRMSLAEIKEQKTQVRLISGLPHYNKIEHITGRTQMERFAARATAIVEGTVSALDDLKKTYAGVLTYFGEDERMPSNEFFGTMKKFALEFQTSAEQVDKDEKAKLKEQARAAAKKVAVVNRLASIVSPVRGMKAPSLADLQTAKQSVKDIAALATERVKTLKLAKMDDGNGTSHFQTGGIGALAAAAALKKLQQTDKIESSATGSSLVGGEGVAGGGIAALAAQAARNRNSGTEEESVRKGGDASTEPGSNARNEVSRSSPFLAGGGIAALAARAAWNSIETLEEDSASIGGGDTSSEVGNGLAPVLSGGGSAAAAARNLKKASKVVSAKNVDDIAADESDVSNSDVGKDLPQFLGGCDIAVAAAAAAAARNLKRASKAESAKDIDNSTGPAADKSDAVDASSDVGNGLPPFLGGGGIAAAAAAAAAARNLKKALKEVSEKDGDNSTVSAAKESDAADTSSEVDEGLPRFLGGGGIAEAAAAAAAARNLKRASNAESAKDGDNSTGPTADESDAVDASSGVGNGLIPFLAGGGIAAPAAATRYVKKALKEVSATDGDNITVPAANESDATDTSSEVDKGLPRFLGGCDIAVATAAAAAARNLKRASKAESAKDVDNSTGPTADKSDAVDASSDVGNGLPPFLGGGGIAAAAAAAAAARNLKKALKEVSEKDGDNSTVSAAKESDAAYTSSEVDKGLPRFLGGGGIAEAAAAAAAARNLKRASKVESAKNVDNSTGPAADELDAVDASRDVGNDLPLFLGRGGIGAIAVVAARNRNVPSKVRPAKNEGYMKEPGSDSSKEVSGPLPFLAEGGIAALAAQAARNCNKSTEGESEGKGGDNSMEPGADSSNEVSGPRPFFAGGGIAALAAQAARNRNKSREGEFEGMGGDKNMEPGANWGNVNGPPPFLAVGDTDAIPAVAARNRNKGIDDDTESGADVSNELSGPPPFLVVGGITAMAALAARNRNSGTDDGADPGAGPSNEVSGPPPFPAGGGIAALAAQAAWNRNKGTEGESAGNDEDDRTELGADSSNVVSGPPPLLAEGGIVALTAQAARNRTKGEGKSAGKDGVDCTEPGADLSNEVSGPPPFFAVGGIAQVARNPNEGAEDESRGKGGDNSTDPCAVASNEVSGPRPFFLGGGIAALAAQAARNRNKASEDVSAAVGGDDSMEPAADGSHEVSGLPPVLTGGGITRDRKKAPKEKSAKDMNDTVESDTTNAITALPSRYHIEVAEGKPDKDENDRSKHASDESATAAASISTKFVPDSCSDVRHGIAADADESEAAQNQNMASNQRDETKASGVSSLFSDHEFGGIAAAIRLVEESMDVESIETARLPSLGRDVTKRISQGNTFLPNEVSEVEREARLEGIGVEQPCDVVPEVDGSEVSTLAEDWLSLDMLLVDGLVVNSTIPVGSELGKSVDVSAGNRDLGSDDAIEESVDVLNGKEEADRKKGKRAKKEVKQKKKKTKKEGNSINHQSVGKDFGDAIPEALPFCIDTEPSTVLSILPKTNSGDVHLEENKKATATEIQNRLRVDSGPGDIFHAASADPAESSMEQKLLGGKNGLMSVTPNYTAGDEGQGSTDVPCRDADLKGCIGSSDALPSPSGIAILQQNDLPCAPSSKSPASPSKAKGLRWMRRFNEHDDSSIASGASYDSAARDGSQASDGSQKGSSLHQFMKKSPKGKR